MSTGWIICDKFCFFFLLSFLLHFFRREDKRERITSLSYIYSPKIIHRIQNLNLFVLFRLAVMIQQWEINSTEEYKLIKNRKETMLKRIIRYILVGQRLYISLFLSLWPMRGFLYIKLDVQSENSDYGSLIILLRYLHKQIKRHASPENSCYFLYT